MPGHDHLDVPGPAAVAATAHLYLERLDDAVRVDGTDGHHLQRVRRVRVGERVTAADGWGRWREYAVGASDAGVVELTAVSDLEHEHPVRPGLSVAFSLTKGEKPELAVQKLTELGADRIVVVVAERSVVRWDDTRAVAAMERLQRVAREAGAQSRRARVPLVDGPVPIAELFGDPSLVRAAADGVAASDLAVPASGEWHVVVGPEGGFSAEELDAFGPAPRLSLGPFVLRAETAAIAAAAALAGRRRSDGTGPTDRREW